MPSTNPSRIASPLGRLGERRVEVRVEVVLRLEPEDAALAARVGGLQHRGEADRLAGGTARSASAAHGREPRLRHARVGERAPHRDLVRHPVRRLRADPGQAERARRPRRRPARRGRPTRSARRRPRAAAPTSVTASTSVKSTASPTSASWSPSASGLRSTATTRSPSSFARRIARRWWRPAPTKRTVWHRLRRPGAAEAGPGRGTRRGSSGRSRSRPDARSVVQTAPAVEACRSRVAVSGPP